MVGALQDITPRNPSPIPMEEITLLSMTRSDLSTEKRPDSQESRQNKQKWTKSSESPNIGVPFLWRNPLHSEADTGPYQCILRAWGHKEARQVISLTSPVCSAWHTGLSPTPRVFCQYVDRKLWLANLLARQQGKISDPLPVPGLTHLCINKTQMHPEQNT